MGSRGQCKGGSSALAVAPCLRLHLRAAYPCCYGRPAPTRAGRIFPVTRDPFLLSDAVTRDTPPPLPPCYSGRAKIVVYLLISRQVKGLMIRSLKQITFPRWSIPLALAAVCLLAYGLLAPGQG